MHLYFLYLRAKLHLRCKHPLTSEIYTSFNNDFIRNYHSHFQYTIEDAFLMGLLEPNQRRTVLIKLLLAVATL